MTGPDDGRYEEEPTVDISYGRGTSRMEAPPDTGRRIFVLFAIGSLVSVVLGVYGSLHEPQSVAINVAGFSGPQAVKAWLTTLAFVLALVQLWSALVMWGRMPGMRTAPSWIAGLHRWSGRLAVLTTVPVAVHCLYALGFDHSNGRVLAHSLLGCLFYGAFVVKMLSLSRPGTPKWTLPVVGGVVFAALTGLWVTASLWFFTTSGLKF